MSGKLLRIFVSSPGDVGEERVMAERVIERLTGEFGRSVTLEPYLWEHEPVRATATFQEQIVAPSLCDIVVTVLWSRLGTRLPRNVSAEGKTGTEWEFEDAARSYQERQIPDLLVYRKTREPVASIRDEASYDEKRQQLKALDSFVKRWFQSADGTFQAAFKTFETLDQFESLLETDLRKLIRNRIASPDEETRIWHEEPFRGLEPFDFRHAPIFFGRTRAIGALKEALVEQDRRGCPFVLVFGMSGVGKSSLVRAGLLPTITRAGVIEGIGLWRWCLFRPSDAAGDLFDGLAAALYRTEALPELKAAGVAADDLARLLRGAPEESATPVRVGLHRAAEETAAREQLLRPPETRLAIVVDQMEELFSLERIDDRQRQGFVKALAALARRASVWVIGTMRSDFYPRCAELPELAALKQGGGEYQLLPPTTPEIHQMISYPARAAGLAFEEKENGERLDHVLQEAAARDVKALPLLEFTLAELYKLRKDERWLTFRAYDQLGGMEGALGRRAEEEFAKLTTAAQAALPAVCRALVTVRHGEEEAVVTQPAPRQVLEAVPEQKTLVNAFIEARLLVADQTSTGEVVVRFAHEALLRRWQRLEKCLAADLDFLRIRERVKRERIRWEAEGKLPELLLQPGKPLAEAEFLLRRRNDLKDFDPSIAPFIEVSQQSAQRARRRQRRLTTALVVSLLVGTALAIIFAIQTDSNARLQKEKDRAEINEKETLAQKKIADLQTAAAEKQRNQTQAQYFRASLERDLRLCESGEVAPGLLMLARSLERQRGVAGVDLEQPLRRFLAGWAPAFHHPKLYIPHKDDILAVAVSPDGRMIITGSKDHAAYLWRTATGDLIAKLDGHAGAVIAVACSPDGSKILTGSQDKTARLWDSATGKPIGQPLRHEDGVSVVVFSPDGQMFCTVSGPAVQRWQTASAQAIGEPLKGAGFAVGAIGFSPNGKVIATADRFDFTPQVHLWDAASGKPIGKPLNTAGSGWVKIPTGEYNDFASIAFSSDSRRVVTAWHNAYTWEAATGSPAGVAFENQVPSLMLAVAINPNDMTVLTGNVDSDRPAQLWNATYGKQIGKALPHLKAVHAVAFSPDGKLALTGGEDHTARIWDAATADPIGAPMRHQATVRFVAFTPDGKSVITSSDDRTVRVWALESNSIGDGTLADSGYVGAVAFSNDGKLLAIGGGDSLVHVLDGATGLPLARPLLHDRAVSAVAVRADAKLLITGTQGGVVQFWNTAGTPAGKPLQHPPQKTGKIQKADGSTITYDRPPNAIDAVAFSPDGKTAASASKNNTVQLWDVQTSRPIGEPLPHDAQVFALAFSPDSKLLISGSADKTVRRWNASTSRPEGEAIHHPELLWAMALSPDGQTLLTAGGLARSPSASRLWNLPDGKPLGAPLQHQGMVQAAAFSPQGNTVLTGGDDGNARLWDAVTGSPLSEPLRHPGPVRSVAFSKDGALMATGSEDGTVRLWDVATGQPAAAPWHTRYPVQVVALHPEGTNIVAGTGRMEFVDDGTRQWGEPRLWKLPAPLQADLETIVLWLQINTGLELDAQDRLVQLAEPALRERWRDLQRRGGAPRRFPALSGPSGNAVTFFLQGKKQLQAKNTDHAVAELSESIRLDPRYANAYDLRGQARQQRRDYKEALVDFSKAIEIEPENALYFSHRASVHVALGDYRKALEDDDKLVKLKSGDANSYYYRGIDHLNLLEHQKALDDFSEAIRLAPKLIDAYRRRADAYAALSEWEKAAADLSRVIEVKSENPRALAYDYGKLAWMQLRNRQPKKAISAAESGVKLDPKQVWINTNLAHGYLFDGQFEKARAIYLKFKDVKINDKTTLAQAVIDDFKQIRAKDSPDPKVEKEMQQIEELLK